MSAAGASRALLAYLVLTAVVCGGLVMVIEVLGSRVIGPFFGVACPEFGNSPCLDLFLRWL